MTGIIDSVIGFVKAPFKARDEAEQFQHDVGMSGEVQGPVDGGKLDAARHAMWMARTRGLMREASGSDRLADIGATAVGDLHEAIGKADHLVDKAGKTIAAVAGGKPVPEFWEQDREVEQSAQMDYTNNEVGRRIGAGASTFDQAKAAVLEELRRAALKPTGSVRTRGGLVYRR